MEKLAQMNNPMKSTLSILSLLLGAFSSPQGLAELAAEDALYTSCLGNYQNTYAGLEGHKAFAYARDDANGADRCAWSYGQPSLGEATTAALASCAQNPIKTKCQIVDSDGQWLVKTGDFPVLQKPDQALDAAGIETQMKIAKETIKGNCRPFFKQHLEAPGHKAFGYALSKEGHYACGRAYSNQSPEIAAKGAVEGCEDNKKKRGDKVPQSKCMVFATGNNIVMGVNDFGAEKSVEDFQYAIFKGNLSRIKWYVDADFDPNTPSKDGTTPLFVAAAKADAAFFHELVSKGAKLDTLANDKSNLLIAAVMGEDVNLIRYLLAEGQDVNKQGRDGNTSLHVAFSKLSTYIVTMLIQEGADTTIANDEGKTGESIAKRWKLDLDKAKNPDVEARDSDGWTALMLSAVKNDSVGVKNLIAKGADVNTRDNHGSTSIIHADNLQVLAVLLANKAQINAVDDYGTTALMAAAEFGKYEKAEFLLGKGADKNLKDNKGRTAADIATDQRLKALFTNY